MKRDMDFVRELLLKIESGQTSFDTVSSDVAAILHQDTDTSLSADEADKIRGHLDLLEDAGFIAVEARMLGGSVWVKGLTWNGHEFLDTIRDDEVWSQTKATVKKAGTGGLELVWEIAKSIAKAEVKRRTGIEIS